MKRTLVTAGLALSVLVAGEARAGSDDLEGKAPLLRPDPAPDADAKGTVKLEHDPKKDEGEFKVKAERLDPALSFELFLEDAAGSGNLVSVGTMEADDDEDEGGEFKIEFESEDGLPLGVSSVQELVGRALEVQSGGVVYLFGTVPEMSQEKGGKWQKAKSALVRPEPPVVAEAKGKIEVRSRSSDNRHRFKVKAEHLPADSYHLFVEDAVGSGQFVDAGAMAQDDEDDDEGSEYEFKADTKNGDALPAGAQTAAELAGRRVEVRDSLDQVVLYGTVPDVTMPPSESKKQKAKAEFEDPASEVEGKIEIRSDPKKGSEEIKIKAEKLPEHATVELYMHDDAAQWVKLADLETDGDGDAKWRARTKKGEPLPFGVAQVADLSGRGVKIRDPASGQDLLQMVVPSF